MARRREANALASRTGFWFQGFTEVALNCFPALPQSEQTGDCVLARKMELELLPLPCYRVLAPPPSATKLSSYYIIILYQKKRELVNTKTPNRAVSSPSRRSARGRDATVNVCMLNSGDTSALLADKFN